MTPKEALKGIKQAIAEHLHKQTGVSVEKHFEYLQYDTEIDIVDKALNDLERLKKFKETFDNYELAKRQDFIAYENWLECENELAELKCDVKRYFELYEQAREKWGNGIDDKEAIEYTKLHLKLLEVGKEEKENETN